MRHADGGIPGLPFGALRWRGWTDPIRRARQAASLALVGTILMLGGANTHAHARLVLPDGAPVAEANVPVRPINGWTEFCGRMPHECTVDAAEPASISLTVAVWRTLQSVNRRVNARIRPITDQAHWGVVDRWDFPDDGFGDCEDYQLLKRRMLVERGLPRRALLMTVVIDEINEGHAVLTVRTDRGDFILDNKTDAIRPWRRTGYSFIKRAGQDGPAWVSLEGKDGTAQVATAEP
ncbi:transglutaminase-like cysteine peptidase [Methylobacterium sp. NEAU K]|uniref:transglutaminase-like cysteine peptidase n=1 Tax=Methylobacterium sp. NEAU K TaxID=3064946 RepID=UPI002732A6C1|nr:transglutaminase-like cysteine peptidase [Methylobacterium sp. NEAU K]MDP4005493.1 transglutaminase-like cysteine peptidase [Methylobacterium sp. NEAU K]